jgi:predicted transcriptional regulator
MGEVRFTLSRSLEQLGVSPYRLSVVSGVRNNTIYNMLENKTQRINVQALTDIINGLNTIAKEKGIHKKFDINDVLEFVEK